MSDLRLPRRILEVAYEKAAQRYLASLPLEHFMEATPHSTQREITVESFALLRQQRPDFHYFNELLVQYPHGRPRSICQVVPDNMVVLTTDTIHATTNFSLELESAAPFWMLEYVSKNSTRKDYEDNFTRYERHLKVPYYLIFYPDNVDLSVYRLVGRRYRAIVPDDNERCAIPELDLEVGLLEGWVRYWYRGSLLPLPAELFTCVEEVTRERDALARQLGNMAQQHDVAVQQRDAAVRRSEEMARELAALRAQLGLPAQ